ncbi:hypothetical protein KKF81_00415 [Candidatus Micrarchaeota archaeon]|nr:hypothetical protein [Candidatus Micrarchaeota archaeon]
MQKRPEKSLLTADSPFGSKLPREPKSFGVSDTVLFRQALADSDSSVRAWGARELATLIPTDDLFRSTTTNICVLLVDPDKNLHELLGNISLLGELKKIEAIDTLKLAIETNIYDVSHTALTALEKILRPIDFKSMSSSDLQKIKIALNSIRTTLLRAKSFEVQRSSLTNYSRRIGMIFVDRPLSEL